MAPLRDEATETLDRFNDHYQRMTYGQQGYIKGVLPVEEELMLSRARVPHLVMEWCASWPGNRRAIDGG